VGGHPLTDGTVLRDVVLQVCASSSGSSASCSGSAFRWPRSHRHTTLRNPTGRGP